MHPAKLPTAVGCSQRDPGPWHKLGATLDLCPLCLGSGQPKVPCGLADGSAMLFIAAQNPASAQAPSVPVGTLRSIGSVVKYKNTRAMHIFKKEKKKNHNQTKKQKPDWLHRGVPGPELAMPGWARMAPAPVPSHPAPCSPEDTHVCLGPFFYPRITMHCLS